MRKTVSTILVLALLGIPTQAHAGGIAATQGTIFQALGGVADQGAVGTPLNGQVLTYSTATNSWRAATGLAPGGSIVWALGGTYAQGPTAEIVGPGDAGFFINAGAAASGTTGRALSLAAGSSAGAANAGALTAVGGSVSGASQSGGLASITGGNGMDSGSAAEHGASIVANAGTGNAGGSVAISGGDVSGGVANQTGGAISFVVGRSAGAGAAGASDITMKTGFTGASGTALQTLGERFRICGHSVTMSTTTATATGIVIINMGGNGGGGCIVLYEVVASDGSNINTATGQFTVSCSEKAGVVTATASSLVGEISNNNSGTLSAGAISTTIASNQVTVKIAPTWGTIVPTSVICTVTVIPFGSGVTLSAQ